MAVWLSHYCGAKHSFTVATVGVVTVAAYGICCAFLTMHDQASYMAAAYPHNLGSVENETVTAVPAAVMVTPINSIETGFIMV